MNKGLHDRVSGLKQREVKRLSNLPQRPQPAADGSLPLKPRKPRIGMSMLQTSAARVDVRFPGLPREALQWSFSTSVPGYLPVPCRGCTLPAQAGARKASWVLQGVSLGLWFPSLGTM